MRKLADIGEFTLTKLRKHAARDLAEGDMPQSSFDDFIRLANAMQTIINGGTVRKPSQESREEKPAGRRRQTLETA